MNSFYNLYMLKFKKKLGGNNFLFNFTINKIKQTQKPEQS
jgi:hypothetical protein